MNSNTFQDQPGQKLSYKFGSLCHTDAAVHGKPSSTTSSVEIGKSHRVTGADRLAGGWRSFPDNNICAEPWTG